MLFLNPLTEAARKTGDLEGRIGLMIGSHVVVSGSVQPGNGRAPYSLAAKWFGPYPQVFLGEMLNAAKPKGTNPAVLVIDTAPSGSYLWLERGLAYCGEKGDEPLGFRNYKKLEAGYVLSIGAAYTPDNQNCAAWKVGRRDVEGEYGAEEGKKAAVPNSPKDFSDPCLSEQ